MAISTDSRMRLVALVVAVGLTCGAERANARLVACVGDSNTYGALLPDREHDCYPAQLQRILQQYNADWEAQNFGINEATVLRQGDTPYVNQDAYVQALASEPNVVIICFGPNASRSSNRGYIQQSYVSDYRGLIDAFAELPSKPKIWLCCPLKAHSESYTISDAIIREEIIPVISQVALERDLPVIDFYTAFEDSPELYQWDGIHPNSAGARLMAEMVSAFLTGVRANPDLNDDGIVDAADVCMVVDHWHTSEPSCDIAPPPFGDGMVDVQDLCSLGEYLLTFPGAAAYWRLDETEGDIAHDSAANSIGTLIGGPVWQPANGMVDGALEFDGVEDHITADLILDAEKGPFSILVWVKGGAPGQVIVSQADAKVGRANYPGCSWLEIDARGHLTTVLVAAEVITPLLDVVVTDGQWHQVGLIWNQSSKTSTLYVDQVEVAVYAEPVLPMIKGGLQIGVGRDLGRDTFFAGLIDDVHIYKRAVRP